MITVTLTRQRTKGKAVFGTLTFPLEMQNGTLEEKVTTLENADYLIPAGTYPLRLTWSPRFKKPMPLIDEVPDREGIRCADTALAHVPKYILAVSTRACSASPKNIKFSGTPEEGTKPEHSQGCILVSALDLENIKVLFNQRKKWYDESELRITIQGLEDSRH